MPSSGYGVFTRIGFSIVAGGHEGWFLDMVVIRCSCFSKPSVQDLLPAMKTGAFISRAGLLAVQYYIGFLIVSWGELNRLSNKYPRMVEIRHFCYLATGVLDMCSHMMV